MNGTEKPVVKTVQTGAANDQFTEIVSGLEEGEQVVIPTTTIRSINSRPGGPGGPGGGAVIVR